MQRIISLCIVLTVLIGAVMASGCTAYNVAVDERNVSSWASDEKITFTIKEQFLEDDKIKYMDFDAASYEGQVYILGEYDSRGQIDRAVSIAKSVTGVHSVTTYLLPKKANDTCGTTDNLEIYARLTKELVADKNIWSTNIDVKTVQCNVVLLGIVGTEKEKSAAYAHASKIPGVRSVKSYITVK